MAPNHFRCQALSVLLATVASGDMTERTPLEHHERLTEVKMCLLGDRVSRRTAWRLAREHGWDSTLDAEFEGVDRRVGDGR